MTSAAHTVDMHNTTLLKGLKSTICVPLENLVIERMLGCNRGNRIFTPPKKKYLQCSLLMRVRDHRHNIVKKFRNHTSLSNRLEHNMKKNENKQIKNSYIEENTQEACAMPQRGEEKQTLKANLLKMGAPFHHLLYDKRPNRFELKYIAHKNTLLCVH